jgi:G3E family GTPase
MSRYVLTAEHGYKIAVCMNGELCYPLRQAEADSADFGDTTDHLAKSLTLSDPDSNSQTTALLSLPNGCLCCSFKDMGIAAIEEMVASQKGVDWVMVELTGVADPGQLL